MDTNKMREVVRAVRKTAKRELGLLLVMGIFGLAATAIAIPLILVISLLPGWAVWVMFAAWGLWLVFGETIAAGVRAYRGVKP